jgi:hypothetical protein
VKICNSKLLYSLYSIGVLRMHALLSFANETTLSSFN